MNGESEAAALSEIGRYLLLDKFFMTSVHFIWVYDYLLTLGDEINYAWTGRKSRLFGLFFAIRYSPVPYLICVNVNMFLYTESFCKATKWVPVLHSVVFTLLSQIAVALRLYAVTQGNKLLASTLFTLIITQVSFGTYCVIRAVLGPAKPLLGINLDSYKICFPGQWQAGGFAFTGIATTFDIIAFAAIVITAMRPGARYPGIPSILDTILRDATTYFILSFICQVCLLVSLVFAPEQVKFLPGIASTIFIPTMASRLMLSLKKSSVEQRGMWTFETMSARGEGGLPGHHTIRFASGWLTSETRGESVVEGIHIELEPRPISLRNSGP